MSRPEVGCATLTNALACPGEGSVLNSVTLQGLGGTTFPEINQWRLDGFLAPESLELPLRATAQEASAC